MLTMFADVFLAPYIPPIDPSNASDTQNFDDTFLDMNPVINDEVGDNEQTDTDGDRGEQTDTDRTDGEGSNATPSRSRSSSTHPRDDGPDVFDGYSFKGRHSVILDEEEEEDDEEEEEDEDGMEETIGPEVVLRTDETTPAKAPAEGVGAEEEEGEAAAEPKTPEAKPAPLVGAKPGSLVEARLVSEEEVTAEEPEAPAPPVADEGASAPPAKEAAVEEAEAKAPAVPPKPTPRPVNARVPRNRREKSGVPALDRYLSDGVDEEGDATEREEEDDDWDIVERGVFEDRNGVKGTSLFARGVVDRYRLAVFRKASPPSRQNATEDPAEKTRQHRGRERGILRRHPKELLQASKQSSMRSGKSGAFSVSSAGPSLKSKESTISADASSDQSANGDSEATVQRERGRTREERGQRKPRKLQKYKEGAEKVLSLFASPRQS